MVATTARPRLHDPGTAAEAAVREFEPRRRLRGKTAVDDDAWRRCEKLDGSEEDQPPKAADR